MSGETRARDLSRLVAEGERLGMSTHEALRRAVRIMGPPVKRVMAKPVAAVEAAAKVEAVKRAPARAAKLQWGFALALGAAALADHKANQAAARRAASVRNRAEGERLARLYGYLD